MATQHNIIFAYTRKDALADGTQVALASFDDNIAGMGREVGYKYPIYITRGIMHLIEDAVNDKENYNELAGVMWDILYMSRVMAKQTSESSISFEVSINGRVHTMWVECSATDPDDPTPCLTFSLPEEY